MAKKLTSNKAKEILHDKSVHGHPLTDKQRRFFGAIAGGAKPLENGGWLDAYPEAQNGIEGTMGGLTDIGFDYNGAWGGTMQMGGSLPGAVGFTYARTNSPAPSNGKYAKKTKASAQNGKEMKFYQEGLDWKPKTISKNGAWLDKYQDGNPVEKTYGTYRLPEVVIKPEAKEKGFWDQSISSFLNENKDAGLLGALSSVVTYPLGLPQQAMMYGLTGKVQKPSESLGIDNKLGAFATDVAADPLVLAGLLSDLPKGLNAAKRFLTEETALKNAHEFNPWAFKPNESNWYRQVGKDAYEDALSTKLIREKDEIVSPEKYKEFLKIATTPSESKFDLGKRPPSPYFLKGDLFYPIQRNPLLKSNGKVMGKGYSGSGSGEYLIEGKLPDEAFHQAYGKTLIKNSNPSDMWPGDTGVLMPNPEARSLDNFNLYKRHWLKGYKEIPKKEDGGIIEDDRGQWDHPGEITKINSNQITMQGVNYPVLGISDTGDTQMMQPNQEYKFEGESVTEYPMMQNGGGLMSYREPILNAKDRFMEKQLNKYGDIKFVNKALDRAEKIGYGYGEDNEGPLDAVRHAAMSASVAKKLKVPKVIEKYTPALDDAIRMGAANLMGLGHELYNFNPEGFWMDIKNNYAGSNVGVMKNLSDEQRAKKIAGMIKSGELTIDNPKRKIKKENGGWLNKYE